ncbi:unnamed protein product [Eruca vesicaria subsp. sativa]|uniref:Uncharacterized protein n=1 Tax=Eruca vesicaria subsp. sativa TaxID=29727 RepID=A0ABC8IN85_ERUVS|nr:unnamed protein product [Eruca vesicaria subsp. sativa]
MAATCCIDPRAYKNVERDARVSSKSVTGIYFHRRKKFSEVSETWEKEFDAHRFSYKSLYKATKGFSKDEFLGKGGFGEV